MRFPVYGEIAVIAFGLPIPGPVVGMALLFVSLIVRGSVTEELGSTANGLLRHLSLLFVPAGVGVMAHLARHGIPCPSPVQRTAGGQATKRAP